MWRAVCGVTRSGNRLRRDLLPAGLAGLGAGRSLAVVGAVHFALILGHVAALQIERTARAVGLSKITDPRRSAKPTIRWISQKAPRLPGSSRGAFTDDTVAVLGDMNTLMFGLKKGVGDKLAFPAEDASFKAWLEVAGMFDGSVFQGVLLMSEENFLKLFPERQGYQYFLIEVPPEHATAAAELLETELSEYGLDTEPIAERLARFLAVQNTYLSTFQTLGGLGLLLGTFGLATVMLRNVWERQAEFALLRAVGFVPRQIAALVLTENAWLLMWGLATGAISALVAMTPHLSSTGAEVPWTWVLGLLAAVFVAGCAAAWGAVRTAVRLPIVATLRGE
jgi:putative ABC transport system permease protein